MEIKMSKKVINTATKQVEMYGYFAGVALFDGDKEVGEKYRMKFEQILDALELLQVMTWEEAFELLKTVYFKSRRNGYKDCKAISV